MLKIFITGVSSGLGRELTKQYVASGHEVWGIARRQAELYTLSEELGKDNFLFSVCDISSPAQIDETKTEMENNNFIPDIVILNAGINPEANKNSFSIDEIEETIQINYLGALRCIEIFMPYFLERKKGQFAAISSLNAYRGDSRWIGYSASKSALSKSFESLRGRYTDQGITFTTIHLGAVDTGMGANSSSPFKISPSKAADSIIKTISRKKACKSIPIIPRILIGLFRVFTDRMFSRMMNQYRDYK
ncbi:MAG: SDR family NAD(P)-dependent oxidoreductase [Nitrospinota bacterium]|nr:SDR family NAD(P)-dependent oxidoreductase [Nitrospinota bacterium]